MAAILLTGCAGAAADVPDPAWPVPPPERPAVVMVVGDSFAVGSGPVPAWQTYPALAARTLGWQLITAGAKGIGFVADGKVNRSFQQSFVQELSWRPEPDLVLLSGGHNDRGRSATKVRDAATQLIHRVRQRWPRAKLVVVGPIWLRHPPKAVYRTRDAIARAAWLAGVPFLDPLTEKWAGDRLLLPDGTHPTEAGHRKLAAWLVSTLRARSVVPEVPEPAPLYGAYQGP